MNNTNNTNNMNHTNNNKNSNIIRRRIVIIAKNE